MPATNDDLLDALNRLAASTDKLLDEQRNRTRQARSASRASRMRWAKSPRRRAMSGLRDIMSGRFKKGAKKLGEAWKGFRGQSMMGKATGPLLVVTALMAMGKAIKQTTDSLIAMNRQYEHASASMAVVMAQRDFSEFRRDMRKGQDVSGSAGVLVDAEQYRKNQHEQIDILGEKLKNYAMAGINAIVGNMLEPINQMAESINEFVDMIAKKFGLEKSERPATASEWADDVSQRRRQELLDNQRMFENVAREAAAARGWR